MALQPDRRADGGREEKKGGGNRYQQKTYCGAEQVAAATAIKGREEKHAYQATQIGNTYPYQGTKLAENGKSLVYTR